MKIVTSGLKFLDIDAYASAIAYAELLRLKGHEAIAFSSATLNASVTPTIRSWNIEQFSSDYVPTASDTFILVDVSEPEFVDRYVALNSVEEVIDRHLGFETYWHDKIGDKADIEFIGAACTMIYERWVAAGTLADMTPTSAGLLMSGILDNTLNFKANVTTDRDIEAYHALQTIAGLPADWPALYFGECQEDVFNDVKHALSNDTKLMHFKNLSHDEIAVGQLVVWDASAALTSHRKEIEETIASLLKSFLVNIVSINEGRSYLLSPDETVQDWAEKVLDVRFDKHLAKSNRLWLRKEIFKQDQNYTK